MSLIDDYIRLRDHVHPSRVGEQVEITLQEIAQILICTPRNSKLIIKKMVEQHLLIWKPGRGRGNRSQLLLLVEPDDLLFGQAKELVLKGKIEEALTLCQGYKERFPEQLVRFQGWLRGHFGFHLETQGERRLDTLRLRLSHAIGSFDPAVVSLRSACHLVKHIYDPLVRYNPDTHCIEPHLAHFWERNQRGDQWTIYLRKGVMFHHGQSLTAYDVAYTLERIQSEQSNLPYRWMLETVRKIQVEHEQKLTITLARPNFMLMELLSSEHLSILPKAYGEEMGPDAMRLPVGSGPFKVVRNDDSMIVLESFDSYFRERAHLDRIELLFVPDGWMEAETSSVAEYGMLYQEGPIEKQPLAPAWNQAERTDWSVQYLSLNKTKKGLLADPDFCKALKLILDQQQLIRDVGGERHEPAYGFLPFETGASATVASSHDCDPAALLAKLGQQEWHLRLHTFMDRDHREDAAWITEQCAKHGITVTSYFYSPEELLQESVIQEADMIHDSATIGDNLELSLLDLSLTEHSFVRRHMDEELYLKIKKEVNRLCEATGVEKGPILRNIEQLLIGHGAVLPLYRNHVLIKSRPELQGVEINSQGWVDYRQLWVKK